jgi:ribonuclease-3
MLPERNFSQLEARIGYTFKNQNLLQRVFLHRSALNEHRGENLENNERMEFLGDAVLELISTEYLYNNFKNPEGELTNWRSALVRGQHLAVKAEQLEFGDLMYLSRGEQKSGGKAKQLILANAFEALIGAMYLDGGYDCASKFVHRYIISDLNDILSNNLHLDPKSHLQELTQEKHGITPNYRVLKEEGPDHNKQFVVGAYLGEKQIGEGSGTSKQTAQIAAAANALASQTK